MDELRKKRRRLRSLMRYAVPDEQLEQALDLLLVFRDDRTALMVLEEFYTCLPDAREDRVRELRAVAGRNGIFLIAAVTRCDIYLYLISSEGVEFHSSLTEGYLDSELLNFFGFASAAGFKEATDNVENLPLYQPLQIDYNLCPACHAATGELHELGCPVEICPWCGGQLIRCDCRFEQLELDEIGNEQDLIRLEALLARQGRLAYVPEQRPSFADEGAGAEIE